MHSWPFWRISRNLIVPHKQIFAEQTDVSHETLEKYDIWHKLLIKWNAKINLVAKSTLPEFWVRHALDSWQITPYLRVEDRHVLDFGSGAGFPGIACAIKLSEMANCRVTLVESAGKKASFLRTVIRELDLSAHVHGDRLEALEPFPADVITARAFAPLPRLFNYASPFLSDHTQLILLKGGAVDEELKDVSKEWTFTYKTVKSLSDEDGCVLIIKNLKRI